MILQFSEDVQGHSYMPTIIFFLSLFFCYQCGVAIVQAQESRKIEESGQAEQSEPGQAEQDEQVIKYKVGQLIDREFENELLKKLPMDPDHIKEFKKRLEATTKAMRSAPPKQIITKTRKLNLEPGGKPPKIILNPHFVTGVSFFDSTGEPWPITSLSGGNKDWFSVERPKNLKPGNYMTISPIATFANSNVLLTLQDWNLPVMVLLETSDVKKNSYSDGNIAFMANRRGPAAKKPIIAPPMPSPITDELLAFLDAVPPEQAVYMKNTSHKEGVDLWEYKEKLYLRTAHHLIWPAWDGTVKGINGITLYTLPIVNSLIISENGKKTTLKVN